MKRSRSTLYIAILCFAYLPGCGTINSPFLSKEEKFSKTMEKIADNQNWKKRSKNLNFLFKNRSDSKLLYTLVKFKSDFKTLDFYAAQAIRRWDDTYLLQYFTEQLESRALKIIGKVSECRQLIQSANPGCLFSSKANIDGRKKLPLFLRFAKVTDKHFYGISEFSYSSNQVELTPKLLLSVARNALISKNDKVFIDTISEIKKDHFSKKTQGSSKYGLSGDWTSYLMRRSFLPRSELFFNGKISNITCAGICAACLEGAYWLRKNDKKKALNILIIAYKRAKEEKLEINEEVIWKAFREWIEEQAQLVEARDKGQVLRKATSILPDFRMLLMIVYLQSELGNQIEKTRWLAILNKNWKTSMEAILFPENN